MSLLKIKCFLGFVATRFGDEATKVNVLWLFDIKIIVLEDTECDIWVSHPWWALESHVREAVNDVALFIIRSTTAITFYGKAEGCGNVLGPPGRGQAADGIVKGVVC
jgi:hypothetical protein